MFVYGWGVELEIVVVGLFVVIYGDVGVFDEGFVIGVIVGIVGYVDVVGYE